MEVVGFHQTFDLKLNVSTSFESLGKIKGHGDRMGGFLFHGALTRQPADTSMVTLGPGVHDR